MNRINSISDRLAAYSVILALMFPDAVALARVIELQPWSHQSAAEQISHISTEKVSPNHQEFSINESEANRILKNEIQIPAQEQLVFIGRSEMDPVASPNNDFVSFFVSEEQLGYYKSATLNYSIDGIEGGDYLVKSVNNIHVYGTPSSLVHKGWQKNSDEIAIEDLRPGINTVRFNLPASTQLNARIKEVNLVLNEKDRSVKINRFKISELTDQSDVLLIDGLLGSVYALNDAQTPSVPTDIVNATDGAFAYYIEFESNREGGLIRLPINPNILSPGSNPEDIHVFYFNEGNRKWTPVLSDSMSVDLSTNTTYKYIPSQPGSFYMAGSQRTPSMPETSASFLDRMGESDNVGSPIAGVSMPSAPQINQQGDAATSIPLNIPPGRNGMQPNISIGYNSSNPGGYIGVGWSIPISTISVSTKWGVPLYDGEIESEVYALDGEDLTMEGGHKPNRYSSSGDQQRKNGTVVFFERTRGGWKKIERIGDSPSQYVWVVTDENNTRFYYGTDNGVAVSNNSTLRAGITNGEIAQWNLSRIEDQWGNVIVYHYEKGIYQEVDNTLDQGQWIYLGYIEYTGYNQGGTYIPGQNKVRFEYSNAKRSDSRSNLRYGFKVTDFKLLSKIHIEHVSTANAVTAIREYQFDYDQSSYLRNRLSRFTESVNGSEFYSNTFEYFDDQVQYSSATESISVQGLYVPNNDDQEIDRDDQGTSGISTKYSPLGGSFNEHYNVGAFIGAGAGVNPYSKGLTLGGGTYFGLDFTNGRSSLQDINGDGIPDLIWQLPNTSSGIQFQAGQLDADRKLSFSTLKTVQAETGITPNKFNRMRSWSNSTTVNAYLGTEYLGASVGHSWDWSKGKNTHFFTDANADGIADLVIKGDVAFGSVDHANGDVKYLKTSELTSNPIINFNPIDEDEVDPDESFPLEIVRSWTAPVSGTITYSSTLVVPTLSTDGVNASIELFSNNTTTILKPSQSYSGGQNVSLNASNNLNVNKGDMLFFRLNAKSDPTGDKSTWNPSVTYVSAPEVSEGNSYDWLSSSVSRQHKLD